MQCTFVKSNNERCSANAIKDSYFCYWHDPNISEEEKKKAQILGGQGNRIRIKEPLPELKINETSDIIVLLEDTINRVRNGSLDLKLGKGIAYIASILLRALEISDIENRLEYIEVELKKKKLIIKK
jgi:hypothetical protein